jgi:flagellar basal body-associated protein FliL
MNKMVLIIGVVVILVAGVGGFLFLGPALFGGGEAAAAETAEGEGGAEGEDHEEDAEPAEDEAHAGELGALLAIPERVVNLSGEGPYAVLQVTITLEFSTPEGYHAEGGHGGNPVQEEFDAELKNYLTPIEDGLNILLSGKTGTDLVTTEGKVELKEEIEEMVNGIAPAHVRAVYFNKFFMQ